MGLMRVKSGCRQGCVLSGGFSGESISFLFQLLDMASILQCVAFLFKASCCVTQTSASIIVSSLTFLSSLFTYKDPCDCIESSQIIQDMLTISKLLMCGVPTVAQWVKNLTQCLRGPGFNPWPSQWVNDPVLPQVVAVCCRRGSDPVLLWLWCRFQLQF